MTTNAMNATERFLLRCPRSVNRRRRPRDPPDYQRGISCPCHGLPPLRAPAGRRPTSARRIADCRPSRPRHRRRRHGRGASSSSFPAVPPSPPIARTGFDLVASSASRRRRCRELLRHSQRDARERRREHHRRSRHGRRRPLPRAFRRRHRRREHDVCRGRDVQFRRHGRGTIAPRHTRELRRRSPVAARRSGTTSRSMPRTGIALHRRRRW